MEHLRLVRGQIKGRFEFECPAERLSANSSEVSALLRLGDL